MWLTISGTAVVAGVRVHLLWRRKGHVGTFAAWMIVLVGSAIAVPMIGEIGDTASSVTTGTGSTAAAAIIAYTLLGIVIIAAAVAFAWLRSGADQTLLRATDRPTAGRVHHSGQVMGCPSNIAG